MVVRNVDHTMFTKAIGGIKNKQTFADAPGQHGDPVQHRAWMLTHRARGPLQHCQLVLGKEDQATALVLRVVVQRDLNGVGGRLLAVAMESDASLWFPKEEKEKVGEAR